MIQRSQKLSSNFASASQSLRRKLWSLRATSCVTSLALLVLFALNRIRLGMSEAKEKPLRVAFIHPDLGIGKSPG